MTINKFIDETKKGFEEKYGSCDIDIKTGSIKYNENGNNEADKKDNDR